MTGVNFIRIICSRASISCMCMEFVGDSIVICGFSWLIFFCSFMNYIPCTVVWLGWFRIEFFYVCGANRMHTERCAGSVYTNACGCYREQSTCSQEILWKAYQSKAMVIAIKLTCTKLNRKKRTKIMLIHEIRFTSTNNECTFRAYTIEMENNQNEAKFFAWQLLLYSCTYNINTCTNTVCIIPSLHNNCIHIFCCCSFAKH